MDSAVRPLGMKPPPDDAHVAKYPFAAVANEVVGLTDAQVNERLARGRSLGLPRWHWSHDQGWRQGSCVGHACVMERAITNRRQRRAQAKRPYTVRYDPIAPWRLAKARDEWEDTRPEDDQGTSARALYDVLRDVGPTPVRGMRVEGDGSVLPDRPGEADPGEGVVEVNRWATSADEIRHAVAAGLPVPIGTPWMTSFDSAALESFEDGPRMRYTLPTTPKGRLRGYHETCIYGANDRLQAFYMKNSWGHHYPLALVPYELMDTLLSGSSYWADAAVVTDR